MHLKIFRNGESSDLVIGYCDISGMSYGVRRRKSGRCNVMEVKEKDNQCVDAGRSLSKINGHWKLGIQELFVTLSRGFLVKGAN